MQSDRSIGPVKQEVSRTVRLPSVVIVLWVKINYFNTKMDCTEYKQVTHSISFCACLGCVFFRCVQYGYHRDCCMYV